MSDNRMHNPVGWFEIYVQDMNRAKAFYEAVFGRTLAQLPAPAGTPPGFELWAFPMEKDGMGISGALVKMPDFDSGKNSVLVYFVCADCAVEAEKVKRAGGRIEKPKFSIGQFGYIALAVDSEGNMIGLHSMQ